MRTYNLRSAMMGWLVRPLTLGWMALALALQPGPATTNAQSFNSGSNGSDGALNLTTPGVIEFDPVARGLDTNGDNIYHFTTITIAAGVTVRLTARKINGPVFWLASGAVQIDGTLDLNGEDGQPQAEVITAGSRRLSVPGAGGYPGGVGGIIGGVSGSLPPQPGLGPGGGGLPARCDGAAGSAGHANPGGGGFNPGRSYGNVFLVPLLGGSGGGGGVDGVGGGAGGGAILMASSVAIEINGTISANGGNAATGPCRTVGFSSEGGAGSGGALRLAAPRISGAGVLNALGGTNGVFGGSRASVGRIRIEAFQQSFTGSADPSSVLASPFALFLPSTPPSSLRVVSVAGAPVASDPTGSFTMPDVTMNSAPAVPVLIEARNIPPETQVQLHLFSENGTDQTITSTPLAGTLELSTVTVSVVLPSGFSRGFVRATWTP